VRLQNGNWVLVYNDTKDSRNRLAISSSTDDGITWTATRHLEDQPDGSYHYPSVIQAKDGSIHVVYSYFCNQGKTMKHVRVSEEWIHAAEG
jgi:Neuraminidase (sialidase)